MSVDASNRFHKIGIKSDWWTRFHLERKPLEDGDEIELLHQDDSVEKVKLHVSTFTDSCGACDTYSVDSVTYRTKVRGRRVTVELEKGQRARWPNGKPKDRDNV